VSAIDIVPRIRQFLEDRKTRGAGQAIDAAEGAGDAGQSGHQSGGPSFCEPCCSPYRHINVPAPATVMAEANKIAVISCAIRTVGRGGPANVLTVIVAPDAVILANRAVAASAMNRVLLLCPRPLLPDPKRAALLVPSALHSYQPYQLKCSPRQPQ